MKMKRLGHSGLFVSEICLGTMTFGGNGFWKAIGTLGTEAVDRLVGRALDGGVNFVDTANVYSGGSSEEITGRAIRDFSNRDDVVLATKVHGRMHEGPNGAGLSRKAILR